MVFNKKNLIAAAIAGAFALPIAAQAQTSVVVYGKLYPQIVSTSLSDATRPGTPVSTLSTPATAAAGADLDAVAMDAPNSRIGFRGTEDLGSGLKAFFQLEIGFGIDDGVANGTSLFNRDSFVGLSGKFGSVKLGTFDTVFKQLSSEISILGISSGNFMAHSNIISRGGFGASGASNFHLRRQNSINYTSPEVGGFQGMIDYSLGEVAGTPHKNSLVSAGVTYENGPLYLALSHEVHNDFFAGSRNVPTALSNTANPNANSTDKASRVVAAYRITPRTRIEGSYTRMDFNETSGAIGRFANYEQNAWSVSAEHKMGAVTLVGTYAEAEGDSCSLVGGGFCNTNGIDGRMLNLGLGYNLSRRTMLYTVYTRLENGPSSSFSNYGNGRLVTGQDSNTFAVGLSHNF